MLLAIHQYKIKDLISNLLNPINIYTVNSFISFFIKYIVITNEITSYNGTAIKVPYKPKIFDNIRINGINNMHCLNKFKKLDFLTLPTA